jgi:biopolymer transport protein ExbD
MDEVSLTSPLGLRRYLAKDDTRIDPVPFLNVMLLGLFFALFNSQFLLPPGIPIALPVEKSEYIVPEHVNAVVTILPPLSGASASEGSVIFGGDVMKQDAVKQAFDSFLKDHPTKDPVLLVKMDARASIAQLVKVSDAARASGFTSVQIAAEELTGFDKGLGENLQNP